MADKKKPDPVVPVRIPPPLSIRIKTAAEALGWPEAEVMRFCMSIGLEHLKRLDHDLTKLVVDSSERSKEEESNAARSPFPGPQVTQPSPKRKTG